MDRRWYLSEKRSVVVEHHGIMGIFLGQYGWRDNRSCQQTEALCKPSVWAPETSYDVDWHHAMAESLAMAKGLQRLLYWPELTAFNRRQWSTVATTQPQWWSNDQQTLTALTAITVCCLGNLRRPRLITTTHDA